MRAPAHDITTTTLVLRGHPFFATWDDAIVRQLGMIARMRIYEAGEALIEEGEEATHFWILTEGVVGFFCAGEQTASSSPPTRPTTTTCASCSCAPVER